MKTTIDLPDMVYRRLKIRAAESGETIRKLVLRGIERELSGDVVESASDSQQAGQAGRHSVIDEYGWPVLKRRQGDSTVVTNELVNRIREEEGV